MQLEEKRKLYENIMHAVAKVVKRKIQEASDG